MQVAVVAFEDFTDLDVFLLWDLLNRVARPDWQVRLLGDAPQHRSRTGIVLPMHAQLEDASACDAVLFASGPGTRSKIADADYLRRIRLDPERQLVGSICSGALILAALGLLTGKRATTHPTARELLATFPLQVVDEPFVREGNLATAGGCLAAQALVAWVIESLLDKATSEAVLASVRPVGAQPPIASAPLPVGSSSPVRVRGGCLCGGVRFEAEPPFLRAGHCHCSRCRKHSGTAVCTQARLPRERFRLLSGAELIRVYGKGQGAVKAFCTVCGSSLFGGRWPDGRDVSIRMGAFDDDPGIRPQFHSYVASRAPWDTLTDDLPRFPDAWRSEAPKG